MNSVIERISSGPYAVQTRCECMNQGKVHKVIPIIRTFARNWLTSRREENDENT